MFFRLYYNRHKDYPFVWSFDTGTPADERLVKGFKGSIKIRACGFDASVPSGSEDKPKAWIEIEAERVYIDQEGFAIFT